MIFELTSSLTYLKLADFGCSWKYLGRSSAHPVCSSRPRTRPIRPKAVSQGGGLISQIRLAAPSALPSKGRWLVVPRCLKVVCVILPHSFPVTFHLGMTKPSEHHHSSRPLFCIQTEYVSAILATKCLSKPLMT